MLDETLAKAPAGSRSAPLHAQRAQILLALGRLEDAEAAALSAFQAEPGNVRNGNLLVAIYAEQGQLAEAVTRLEEVQEVGALPGPAQELLARLYAQVGREDDAIALYERLIQQDASRASAKNDLAYLLAKRGGDLDRALELARDAKQGLGDDPSAADTLGFVYYRKALYEPAIEQFRSAIAAAEKRPAIQASAAASYHYHLGLALRELDRKGEAIEALKAAVARHPDYPEAKQALAELEGGAGGAGAPQGSS
jgi:tetratricopeptide (TPR) repeat protein